MILQGNNVADQLSLKINNRIGDQQGILLATDIHIPSICKINGLDVCKKVLIIARKQYPATYLS